MTQEQLWTPDECALVAEAIQDLALARGRLEDQLADARAALEGVQRDFDRLTTAFVDVLVALPEQAADVA